MTQHVRKSYRRHRKATWGLVLIAAVAAALALVVPALGVGNTGCVPNTSTCVKPASGQGITPSVVPVGGSNFSCTTHAGGSPQGVRQYQISNPVPGTYTDPATGVQFRLTAPTAGLDSKAFLSFSVVGNAAVVYHVGVKGGTNTSWYDYLNNAPTNKALGNGGVFSDTDLHSTPDSQYRPPPPNNRQTFFAASITTFCFVPLTVQARCDQPFSPGPGFGGGTGDAAQYSVQLEPNGTACKSGNMVMYSYVPGQDELFAVLSPATPGGPKYESVEHIHWSGITLDTQNPITLWYDDTGPDYTGNDKIDLIPCNSDPRTSPTSFDIPGPAPHTTLMPTGHTSCLLAATDSAGSGPNNRSYDAWIFSDIDGGRGH